MTTILSSHLWSLMRQKKQQTAVMLNLCQTCCVKAVKRIKHSSCVPVAHVSGTAVKSVRYDFSP